MPESSKGVMGPAGIPALIEAMARPEFYLHRPPAVEIRQTHISWVFLAGEYVYKLKKPVCFPFLDCSTLDARRYFCLEEVRLNRRLAPNVYKGVRPIVQTNGRLKLGEFLRDRAADAVVDYVVEMARLPEERMLDRLIAEGTLSAIEIHSIAERLVAFHRTAASANAFRYGSAAAVARMVTENLRECERFEGDTLSTAQVAGLADYNQHFVSNNWELLNRRVREGRVREGHGDLRSEQICLANNDVVIFDCLEFSEALRYGDVACDVGFLAMDLERLGAIGLSRELGAYYARLSGDDEFALLLPFYQCYRAVVRGKVESLKSLEPEVADIERAHARELACRYFALACSYARCHDGRSAIIVVFGAAGAGKSTVARALAGRLNCDTLNSDEIRKQLAGASPTTSRKADYGCGIYTEEFTKRTYDAMMAAAERRLADGKAVILDATFRHPEERRNVCLSAARARVPVLFVECRADEAEVLRRLRERAQRPGVVSDADTNVYLRQRADFVPPDEIEPGSSIEVDTTHGSEAAVATVEDWLARRCAEAHKSH